MNETIQEIINILFSYHEGISRTRHTCTCILLYSTRIFNTQKNYYKSDDYKSLDSEDLTDETTSGEDIDWFSNKI